MTEEIKIDQAIDLKGEVCPFPWVKAKKTLAKMETDQILKVVVDHAPAAENIPHNFEDEGQKILRVDKLNEFDWQIVVRRETIRDKVIMSNGIDDVMDPLIEAMNKIPYIETFSCCEGHPEESAVREYGYSVANVIFEIKDEPQNLITWLSFAQEILRKRKKATVNREFAFIIERKYTLNEDNNLGWEWEIKIQATGKSSEECRLGLNEGITFLSCIFKEMLNNGDENY